MATMVGQLRIPTCQSAARTHLHDSFLQSINSPVGPVAARQANLSFPVPHNSGSGRLAEVRACHRYHAFVAVLLVKNEMKVVRQWYEQEMGSLCVCI